jgi:hypothetical protein
MAETGSYKRLEFVAKSASAASGMANTVYKTTRSFTPKFVEPYVAKVEDTAASVGTPYVTFIADTGAKVLKNADDLVSNEITASNIPILHHPFYSNVVSAEHPRVRLQAHASERT